MVEDNDVIFYSISHRIYFENLKRLKKSKWKNNVKFLDINDKRNNIGISGKLIKRIINESKIALKYGNFNNLTIVVHSIGLSLSLIIIILEQQKIIKNEEDIYILINNRDD